MKELRKSKYQIEYYFSGRGDRIGMVLSVFFFVTLVLSAIGYVSLKSEMIKILLN